MKKSLIYKVPVLGYFDPALEPMLQCNTSKSGLGYDLLQKRQLVELGAQEMTQTKRQFIQIKKEILTIV